MMTNLQVEANKLNLERDKLKEQNRHNLETEKQGRTKIVTDTITGTLSAATRPFKIATKLL